MRGHGEVGQAQVLIEEDFPRRQLIVRFAYQGAAPIGIDVDERDRRAVFTMFHVEEGVEPVDVKLVLPADVVLAIAAAASEFGENEWKVRYDEAQHTLGFVREQLERQHIRVDEILRAFLSGPR
jgi:hypothetical protein